MWSLVSENWVILFQPYAELGQYVFGHAMQNLCGAWQVWIWSFHSNLTWNSSSANLVLMFRLCVEMLIDCLLSVNDWNLHCVCFSSSLFFETELLQWTNHKDHVPEENCFPNFEVNHYSCMIFFSIFFLLIITCLRNFIFFFSSGQHSFDMGRACLLVKFAVKFIFQSSIFRSSIMMLLWLCVHHAVGMRDRWNKQTMNKPKKQT